MSALSSLLFASENAFFRAALCAGLLSSVAFGVVGSHVVARRISYLAGAIAHSALGGIGAALYAKNALGWRWADPTLGALAAALLSALAVWWVATRAREREDAAIGAIWSVGMGLGLLFIAMTPGYSNAMSYLFGDILLAGGTGLWTLAILDAVVLAVGLGLYGRFRSLAFDEEFCRVKGLHVRAYSLLLLSLVAATVVVLVAIVGIVLVVALLTLPAATAGRHARSLAGMMLGATLVGLFAIPAGLFASYWTNLPAGPLIVLAAAGCFGLSCLIPSKR